MHFRQVPWKKVPVAGDAGLLAEGLPSMHGALGLIPRHDVTHLSPKHSEVEAGRSEVQDYLSYTVNSRWRPWLPREIGAIVL